jgi:GntR family transcriptional regulator
MSTNTAETGQEPDTVYPMSLDRESRIEIFRQLADIFRGRIQRGEWRPDRRIPSEPDLAAEFEVNRDTVRRSIRLLVRDGWFEVVRGKGTFVVPEADREAARERQKPQ